MRTHLLNLKYTEAFRCLWWIAELKIVLSAFKDKDRKANPGSQDRKDV